MSEKPKRIQRKRTKGYKMPKGAVYVGRPTKWGNPFRVTGGASFPDNAAVVEFYALWLNERGGKPAEWIMDNIEQLRGKDLACFCSLDQPCHADVLLELANAQPEEAVLPAGILDDYTEEERAEFLADWRDELGESA